ncbi:hypothetical protein Avbf_09512 [Armadillidium vulgare]|nr:hypothetical protein Avbf_09512 [Armadillidium vulgare]
MNVTLAEIRSSRLKLGDYIMAVDNYIIISRLINIKNKLMKYLNIDIENNIIFLADIINILYKGDGVIRPSNEGWFFYCKAITDRNMLGKFELEVTSKSVDDGPEQTMNPSQSPSKSGVFQMPEDPSILLQNDFKGGTLNPSCMTPSVPSSLMEESQLQMCSLLF